MARRETGVLVAGAPRLELTIELRPARGAPVVVKHRAVAPAGSASDVGDKVTVALDRRGTVVDVDFRPAIRRPGGRSPGLERR